MKALLMRLLGLRPMWEVRVVSPVTGKNLMGTRIGKATPKYREALAIYRKHHGKVKPDHWLKLQAVIVTKMHMTPSRETAQAAASSPLNKLVDNVKLANQPQHRVSRGTASDPVDESMQRSSDNLRELRDQGITDGPDRDVWPADPAHTCNFVGEMVLIDGAYRATCSVCGEPQ